MWKWPSSFPAKRFWGQFSIVTLLILSSMVHPYGSDGEHSGPAEDGKNLDSDIDAFFITYTYRYPQIHNGSDPPSQATSLFSTCECASSQHYCTD